MYDYIGPPQGLNPCPMKHEIHNIGGERDQNEDFFSNTYGGREEDC